MEGEPHQPYRPTGDSFQQQITQQATAQPQHHNYDNHGVQQQMIGQIGPGFQDLSYQHTGYEAYQNNGQYQYGTQQAANDMYGGQQFRAFEGSNNHYYGSIPGNATIVPPNSHSHLVDHQAPALMGNQSYNYGNGFTEQQRYVPVQEHYPQYPNQNIIHNLHQSLYQPSKQPSGIISQGYYNQGYENPRPSTSEQVKDRQNNSDSLNPVKNLTTIINADNGVSQLAAANAPATNSNARELQLAKVQTPPAPYSGVVPFKKSTPNTAPPLVGAETPTSNYSSRKAQTASKMDLDISRGPPPTFWRDGKAPVAIPINDSSRASSVAKPLYQIQPYGSVMGAGGVTCAEDPFTDRGYVTGPMAMQMTMITGRDRYQLDLAATVPQAGPIVPLAIEQQGGYVPSEHLTHLCPNGAKPSIETALNQVNLPFIEMGRQCGPVFFGVLRISNIPYSTNRAEVIAFLGRNARIINENLEPVHIIMDRVSGKTEEVYVEFISLDEVINAVRRYDNNRKIDRGGLVGDRHVTLEVSSQEQLMKRLFPRAKNVHWDGAQPVIIPTNPHDAYNTGFKGFVNQEEMVMLLKHVEHPARSPFSRECPQRPFECLISTLVKYPWYMSSYITIADRDIIFDGTFTIVKQLLQRIGTTSDHITLNQRLLKRLCHAALRCAGFTEMQKDNIAFICNMNDHGLAPFADHWHVFKVLSPRHGVATDVLLYYVALIREATTSPEYVSLAEQATMPSSRPFFNVPCAFGSFRVQYPPNFKDFNMAQIAEIEWNAVDSVLRKILGPTQPVANQKAIEYGRKSGKAVHKFSGMLSDSDTQVWWFSDDTFFQWCFLGPSATTFT